MSETEPQDLDPKLAGEDEEDRHLLAGLRELPRELAPERDLFPAIAVRARIHDRRRTTRQPGPLRRLPRWVPTLAAGLIVALGIVLMGRLDQPPLPAGEPAEEAGSGAAASTPASAAIPVPSPSSPRGLPAASPAAGALAHTAYADTDRELARIRDELERAVAARAGELPPETRQLIDDNLEVIDRALAEIAAALAAEPTNPELARTYISYRRRQIDLLLQANRAAARL